MSCWFEEEQGEVRRDGDKPGDTPRSSAGPVRIDLVVRVAGMRWVRDPPLKLWYISRSVKKWSLGRLIRRREKCQPSAYTRLHVYCPSRTRSILRPTHDAIPAFFPTRLRCAAIRKTPVHWSVRELIAPSPFDWLSESLRLRIWGPCW